MSSGLVRLCRFFGPVVAAVVIAAGGCSTSSAPERSSPLAIAAAADLRFALDELTPKFEQASGSRVTISYGSSGNFYAQLMNGAPFDLFLSADVAYPKQLVDRGAADADTLFTYAFGRIVVWVPKTSTLQVETAGLTVLTDPSVAHVAIANPEHAPYGRAAEAAMRAASVFDAVKRKLVFGENVAQTLQFVENGSAQAGIVALSLAKAPSVSGRYFLIPADLHPPIEQGGAILHSAANPDTARAFRTFMLSGDARSLLERYGFETSGRGR